MNRRFRFVCALCCGLALLVLVVASCAPLETETGAAEDVVSAENARADAESGVREVMGKYVETFNSEDIEGFVALYTDDAVRMPPDRTIISGVDRIRYETMNGFNDVDSQVTLRVEETLNFGDVSVNRGTWVVETEAEATAGALASG